MTVWHRLGTIVVILVTTAGATFMVLVAPGSGALEAQPVRVFYDLLAAAILLPWLGIAIFRRVWRPSSKLLPAIVIVLIAFAASSVTSRVPRLSFEMLGYAVLLAELYLLLVTLMRRPEIRSHLERLALLLGLIGAVLYVIQVMQAWMQWWGLVGSFVIPPLRPGYLGLWFGSPNPVATLVIVLGAFGLAGIAATGRRVWVFAGGVACLIAVATLLTGSRGAWLGGGVGLVVVAAVGLASQPALRAGIRSLAKSRWGAITIALAVPGFLVAVAIAALSGRLTLDDGGYRAAFARASFKMFDDSPVTGLGPGMWGIARSTYTDASDADYYIPHAHNLYLQTLAEFGAVGILAGAIAISMLAILIGHAIRSDNRVRRNVALACLFGVVAFGVQQLADVLVNVPALLLAIALPIAWLDSADDSNAAEASVGARTHLEPLRRVVMLGATVLTFAILLALMRIEAAADLARRGVASANAAAWSEATTLFSQAVAVDPDVNVYHFELGVSAANSGDLPLAEASLAESADADDYPYAWLDLAAVRWQLGDAAGAREALARAERLGLQRAPIALGAGWLQQQLGSDGAATRAYAAALAQTQALANDPFWSMDATQPGSEAEVFEALESRGSPATLIVAHLVRGEIELARLGADSLIASQPGLYQNLIPAWQGDATAWARLQAEAVRRPMDVTTLGWCRLVAAHLGDQASVLRYSSWLAILGGTDSGLPTDGAIVIGSAEPLPPYILDRYGSLYRREVLAAQVVDGLPQIAWHLGEQGP